ncbi:Uncharacterised protein [uncultured archaeon]|nr:Uncharacterised protein [uncultured archaeon]
MKRLRTGQLIKVLIRNGWKDRYEIFHIVQVDSSGCLCTCDGKEMFFTKEYLVKFAIKPTKKEITLFELGH